MVDQAARTFPDSLDHILRIRYHIPTTSQPDAIEPAAIAAALTSR